MRKNYLFFANTKSKRTFINFCIAMLPISRRPPEIYYLNKQLYFVCFDLNVFVSKYSIPLINTRMHNNNKLK